MLRWAALFAISIPGDRLDTNQLSSDLHRRQQENMSHAEEPIEIEVDGEISLSNQ